MKYIAKIYFDDEAVAEEEGNDVETLYSWMLTKTQGKFGNFSGEIIEIESKKVVKGFRKSPPD
ncbi:MAG: hypothetical protein H0W64_03815 [Gammaproteobacteria bacterium]|nr:hypothetical protein [Gammaproteobacteria bacterium]